MTLFRQLLIVIPLAMLTSYGLRYFFGRHMELDTNQTRSGQRFTAPKSTEIEVHKPLKLEIDFLDAKSTKQPVVTSIQTELARYDFSTDGASLQRVEFKRNWGQQDGYLATVFPPSSGDREKSCFLVALDQKTPFAFELINKSEDADAHFLTYRAAIDGGSLIKKFTVFKQTYRIDLEVGFDMNAGITQQARIVLPSPLVPELMGEDTITMIANDERNNLKLFTRSLETAHSYWATPTLFGAQDRYFVHAMVRDPNHFVQRGYFKSSENDQWYALLEGPEVNQTEMWQLSFYMGPKEDRAMNAVDPRLEQTLNYGMFSFISKPLSQFMLHALETIYGFVHNYGWAIIILTILIKLIMLPFTWRGEQSMKKRAEFQKKLDYLESKFKHDKEALGQARAELIRKHGMPGIGGCVPLLMQIPIFWALSIILANSIELYKAPFLWIPDLSTRDPYYILPLLMVIAMIFHTPAVNDAKQRMSTVGMALFLGAVTSSFAAGLALFMVVSTLLGVVQAKLVKAFKHD